MDPTRLKKLAGIREDDDDAQLERDIAKLDAKDAREKQVVDAVTRAFTRRGLTIANEQFAVTYDDHNGEVTVKLDDQPSGFSLVKLASLLDSGAADDFMIKPYDALNLEVTFTWRA